MADDALVHEAAQIPANEPLPHESLNQSLSETKKIVTAVQQLQKQQEEADRKVDKEVRSHAQTKEKIKSAEGEYTKVRELMEKEVKEHETTKDKLNRAEREHMKTREALQAQRHEVSSMLLQMEALKVEMEAQRKAFVVNVNWASRCTDLKVKFDQSRADYDKLYDQQHQTKQALGAASKAQEDYRIKSQQTLDVLEEARKELARQNEELEKQGKLPEDVQKKLEEWQKFRDAQAAVEISQKHGKSKAMGVLERQLAEGDTGLLMNYYFAWSAYVRDELKRRRHKDQAMKQAMKTIASEGTALLAECFVPWRKCTADNKHREIELANRRLAEANERSGGSAEVARKRALAQLEKQLIGQDKALLKETFQGWALDKVSRAKKDGNMQRGARLIANSAKAMQAEIYKLWNTLTEKSRLKKKSKEANQAKAMRLIANNGKVLQANVFGVWASWVKKKSQERKMKAQGNEKAARMMTNSQGMLMNICFDSWAKLQAAKKKKEAGGKRAARMINSSQEALVATVYKAWKESFKNSKAKEGNTAKAVRMIAASGEALQASCFQGWSVHVRKSKEQNKKIRAVEKTIGASGDLLKDIILTAWRNWVQVETRKTAGKARNMTSAMKSINGSRDLLMTQIMMGWARVTAVGGVEKWQEKVKAAQDALDHAMEAATQAVQEDVRACEAEVNELNKELEKVIKEWNDKKAKAQALEAQIEDRQAQTAERDSQLQALLAELEESRRKARDIGEELAKVGIFLQNSTPAKKKDRPRSGAKSGSNDGTLPKIAPGRPQSGQRSKGGAPVPPAKPAWNEDSSYQSSYQ